MASLATRAAAGRSDALRPLLVAPGGRFVLDDLIAPAPLWAEPPETAPAVAVSIRSPVTFARALLALDGRASGILLLAPTLPEPSIRALMDLAGTTLLVSDRADVADATPLEGALAAIPASPERSGAGRTTEWLMTTSGTTGQPKIVRHTLGGLARTVRPFPASKGAPSWGLLYDPSRFAGLQVVLQWLLGGGVLIAPDRDWAWAEQLRFLGTNGCTHLSATPTLWRKILMSADGSLTSLRQITLGGEIADEPLLRSLAARYPLARVTHIYASTEAGVGFSVKDGRAGFPTSFLEDPPSGVRLKIVDEMLWLRPDDGGGAPVRGDHIARDADGYIRSGDRVFVEGGRVFFRGREDGTINVAGVKLQIEMIERRVLDCPGVAACTVVAKRSPVVGALLSFQVVPADPGVDRTAFLAGLRAWCKTNLQREAQPASIQLLADIDATPAGKTSRTPAQ